METERKQPVNQDRKAPNGRGRTVLMAIILALAVLVIGFAGYSLRNAYRYESAVSLLKDAQYTQAADAFEALGHYRDAASYALYSRAAAAGEAGGFEQAASNLKAMGGFGDSALLGAYYQARALEEAERYEEAAPVYTAVSLYRDAGERLAALPGRISERDYQAALALENNGQWEAAIAAFRALSGYRDSGARAEKILAKMNDEKLAAAYADAEAAETAGRLNAAQAAFEALGDYRDSAARAAAIAETLNARAYARAEDAEQRGDAVTACNGFAALGDYRDSAARAAGLRQEAAYQAAGALAESGDYAGACDAYEALSSYRDSAEKAAALRISRTAQVTRVGEGLAAYELQDKWGLINLNQNRVTVARFDSIGSYNSLGLAKTGMNGLYGFIDGNGIEVVPAAYRAADSYDENGLCRVQDPDGRYGLIDAAGRAVLPCAFDAVSAFSGGAYAVRSGRVMGLVNARGEALTEVAYTRMGGVTAGSRISVPAFDAQGCMAVADRTGRVALMNRQYQLVTGFDYDEISAFSEGLARVKDGRYYGFINAAGELVIAPEWPFADSFSDGLSVVAGADGRYGYINQAGELIIPAVYEDATAFRSGRAAVSTAGIGWYMINNAGENLGFAVVPYEQAMAAMESGDYDAAAAGFRSLGDYADAYDQMREAWYRKAVRLREAGDLAEAYKLASALAEPPAYRDSEQLATAITADRRFELGQTDQAWQLYAQVPEALRRHQEEYAQMYADAEAMLAAEQYDDAIRLFQALGGYGDSAARIEQAYDAKFATEYAAALALMEAGDYDGAIAGFSALGEYSRAQEMAQESRYRQALQMERDGNTSAALTQMTALSGYRDADLQAGRMRADSLFAAGQYAEAWLIYQALDDAYHTHDADYAAMYQAAADQFAAGTYQEAYEGFRALGDYRDSAEQALESRYQHAISRAAEKDYDAAILLMRELLTGWETVTDRRTASVEEEVRVICGLEGYRDAGPQLCRFAAEQMFEAGRYADAWAVFACLDSAYHTRDDAYAALYQAALDQREAGRFDDAQQGFEALGAYSDSARQALETRYRRALSQLEAGQFDEALAGFTGLADYGDSADRALETRYRQGLALAASGEWDAAEKVLTALLDDPEGLGEALKGRRTVAEQCGAILAQTGYRDVPAQLVRIEADRYFLQGDYALAWEIYACLDEAYHTHDAEYAAMYQAAADQLAAEQYDEARAAFLALGNYGDSAAQAQESRYRKALALDRAGDRDGAEALLKQLDGYRDAAAHLTRIGADRLFDRGETAAAWEIYRTLDPQYRTHDAEYQALYEAAEALLADRQYRAAADAFAALGGYSDSAQRSAGAIEAGYADRYAQAQALQASGDFDAAYDMYAALGDYRDSADKLLEVAQQKADHLFEEGRYAEAAEVYRLLGSDRALEADYQEALRLKAAADYAAASAQWLKIADYRDSRKQNYQMAGELAEAGAYETAIAVYCADLDYEDVRERIYQIGTAAHDRQDYRTAVIAWTRLGQYKDSGMNLTMDTYAYGDQLYAAGQYDEAAGVFRGMNGFSNTAERAQESAYRAAMAALEAGEYADAEKRFEALGQYGNSAEMVLEARYRAAKAQLAAGEYESALQAFSALGDYRTSAADAKAAQYALAEQHYDAGRYGDAVRGFEVIRGYRDAEERWRQARFMQYSEALTAGEYEAAVAGFEALAAEGYVPAVEEVYHSHYLMAQAFDAKGNTEAAYREYVLAGQYGDAPAQAKGHAYTLGCALRDADNYPAAVDWFETADDASDAREQLYKIGYYYFSVQDWPNAVNAFKTLAGYRDTSALLCRIGQYYEMQDDRLKAYLAYGYAGPDSDGAKKAGELRDSLTAEADRMMSVGNTKDAVPIYETLAKLDPEVYPKLLAADFRGFLATKGRVVRIGRTDWRFLADENGILVFVADKVLASKAYKPSSYASDRQSVDNWLQSAKTSLFSAAEQPFISSLWVMSKDQVAKYMPSANDRKTTGAAEVWTSTTRNSSSYFTYNASSGSMGNYDYESSNKTYGIRPGLKLRYGYDLYRLMQSQPDRYAFKDSAGKTAVYTSDYQAAYQAAVEADQLKRYRRALTLLERGEYGEASAMFRALGDYQESERMVLECAYQQALQLAASGEDELAIRALEALNGYSDSAAQIEQARTRIKQRAYDAAMALTKEGKDEEAIAAFEALDGFGDSAAQIEQARDRIREKRYRQAEALEAAADYAGAYDLFADADMAEYKDSAERAKTVQEKAAEQKRAQEYEQAATLAAEGRYEEALAIYQALGAYSDSREKAAAVEEAIRARDYSLAMAALSEGRYEEAITRFTALGDYQDSAQQLENARTGLKYEAALKDALAGRLTQAYQAFQALGDYRDSARKAEIVGNLSRAGKTQQLAEGILIYEFHDLWGIANLNTNVITPVKYTSITYNRASQYAKHGLAKVFISGGSRDYSYSWAHYVNMKDKYGYINMDGQEVVACSYVDLTDFDVKGNCTVALVKNEYGSTTRGYNRQYYGIFTYDGRQITAPQWRTMGTSENKNWSSTSSASAWMTENFVISAPTFTNGRMKVQNADGLWGYINEQGRVLGQVKWTSIGAFADGLAMVSEQVKEGSGYYSSYVTRYGFINEQGQTVGQVRWEAVRDFSQGLAAVQENGLWGFIDRTNTLVIPCRYSEVNAFKADGTCDVRNPDGTWVVINRQGENAFFGP